MDKRLTLIPFSRSVIDKINNSDDFSDEEKTVVTRIKNEIDHVIIKDEKISNEVQNLVAYLQLEPTWAPGIRALIRPSMTLNLTIVFVVLVLTQAGLFGSSNDIKPDTFDSVFREYQDSTLLD